MSEGSNFSTSLPTLVIIWLFFIIAVLVSYCCCNKLPATWWLKKTHFIIFQFWRSEAWNGFHGSKIKMLAGLYFFLETLGENLSPNPFQLLETVLCDWVHAPVWLQSQQRYHFDLCFCYHILFSDSSPLASLLHLKEFLWWHWAHVDNPSSFPITRSLS